jgi:hypothetical protein
MDPAGVAACARAGRSKLAWRFTARWFVELAAVIHQLGLRRSALGEFLEREIAMRRVEELVEASMVLAMHGWNYIEQRDDNVR